MKTPDEIKKGLEICNSSMDCNDCPYLSNRFCIPSCKCSRNADALTLIQQREEEKARLECTITQLAGTIKHLREAIPHWISVKERLPERGVFVAVYYGHFIGNLVDTFAWDGESWRNSNGFLEDPENITHWMPLPEPPKE